MLKVRQWVRKKGKKKDKDMKEAEQIDEVDCGTLIRKLE